MMVTRTMPRASLRRKASIPQTPNGTYSPTLTAMSRGLTSNGAQRPGS